MNEKQKACGYGPRWTNGLLENQNIYLGYMEVSLNGGTPKSSILMGFCLINL